jgi:hypothetical protein
MKARAMSSQGMLPDSRCRLSNDVFDLYIQLAVYMEGTRTAMRSKEFGQVPCSHGMENVKVTPGPSFGIAHSWP